MRTSFVATAGLCLCPAFLQAQGNVFGNSAPTKPPIELTWLQVASPPLTPNPRSIPPSQVDLRACLKKVVTPDSVAVPSDVYVNMMVWVNVGRVGGWDRLPQAPTRSDTLRARVINIDCGILSPLAFVLQTGSTFFRLDAVAFDRGSGVFMINAKGLEPALLLPGTCEGCSARIVSSVAVADNVRKADALARANTELRASARRLAFEDEQRQSTALAEAAARLRAAADAEAEKRERAETAKAEKERAAKIRAKGWPAAITKAVISRHIQFGMSREQVRLSWGEPDDIHRTVIPGRVSEQWVYGRQYVYFTDGAVSAWQD